jgi:hypothetical protein
LEILVEKHCKNASSAELLHVSNMLKRLESPLSDIDPSHNFNPSKGELPEKFLWLIQHRPDLQSVFDLESFEGVRKGLLWWLQDNQNGEHQVSNFQLSDSAFKISPEHYDIADFSHHFRFAPSRW